MRWKILKNFVAGLPDEQDIKNRNREKSVYPPGLVIFPVLDSSEIEKLQNDHRRDKCK